MRLQDIALSTEAIQRTTLAIDTCLRMEALKRESLARRAGALVVKKGMVALTAFGLLECSRSPQRQGLDWIADFKLIDTETTNLATARNLVALDHPPIGITVHGLCGLESMRAVREIADDHGIMTLVVAQLSSITNSETEATHGKSAADLVLGIAKQARGVGITGLVCSAQELFTIRSNTDTEQMFTMVVGTRSPGASTNAQARIGTPEQAMTDGADLLVIGRQVTESEDPPTAYRDVAAQIQRGMNARSSVV